MGRSDKHIILVVGILCMIGVVMIFSTSYMKARGERLSGDYYLTGSLVRLTIGVAAMITMYFIDYRKLEKMTLPFLIVTIVLLAMPVLGIFSRGPVNGADRWVTIPLGFTNFSFQPAEITRIALIFYLASFLSKNQMLIEDFKKGFLKSLVFPASVVFILVLQPDYGTALSVIAVTLLMILVAGARIKHLAVSAAITIPIFAVLARTTPYIWKRIQTFLSDTPDLKDGAYQINQSLIALGSGGFSGLGLGEGKQKHFYLPEAHTDFIFSMIGEELGFIGTVSVVLLFGWFLWRGYNIAVKAEDRFGSYLAFGLVTMLFLFAAINMSVALELIPSTGMPLPFLSYGGTALVINLAAIGILLNISKNIRRTTILNEEIVNVRKQVFYGSRRNRRPHPSGTPIGQRTGAKGVSAALYGRQEGNGVGDSSKVGV